jgi:transcriptional antiterminator RfaH
MNLPNGKKRSNEIKYDQQSKTKSPAAGCRLTACPEHSREADSSQRNGVLSWYVVQSKPREEERALHFLQKKGFQVYLPRMEIVKMRGFKNTKTQKPLFPGYLFCRFDIGENLSHVRWTQGVKKLLPESVNPISVENEVVKAIQSLEQKDGVIRKKPFAKNDRIRIARGPMKDVIGIFDHWTSNCGRVRVLLNFINYQASLNLHYSFIERVL